MNDHTHDRGDDPFDELMRRALSEEAGRIEPADGLHEIQARVSHQRKPVSRRPWAITVGAAVVGTAAAIGAFAVLDDSQKNADQPTAAGGPSTTTSSTSTEPSSSLPTQPASPQPTPTPAATEVPTTTLPTEKTRAIDEPRLQDPKAVPVYWLGRGTGATTGPSYRLYRTFNQVKGRPATEAVQLMTTPKVSGDPDYESPWSGAKLTSVRYTDRLIVVDFERLPESKLTPDNAEMAAQQLIYTVQGALQRTAPVQITERGRATAGLFGVIDTTEPLSRAKAADVQAFVWIESPENNQTVAPGFSVSGQASAFEAHVDWKATNVRTKVVVKNFTTTKEGQKLSPYTFRPKLDSGQWLIEVYLPSAEDGRVMSVDSKTVIVK
ncbi:Gmad2 immunoglobulin-like domain-containing protein [Kribbella sp. CA-293567]|uniref:Gmad2 immunoglobulin-like domain-containing protein n=1 Tax=Kribbella sp. CA-293567 TaxID=3002436 RepID=UPI0022DDA936|nr:Gmad2 immunoglobulin-like domain-containing protein [Kribbella sp. CA-293567]WBQ03124.1 GerMN domain-containing protein [Kribbella sp. CA-293567]